METVAKFRDGSGLQPLFFWLSFPGALPQAGIRPRLWRSNCFNPKCFQGRRPELCQPWAEPKDTYFKTAKSCKPDLFRGFETASLLPHSKALYPGAGRVSAF
jgi:hypothetical protein